MYLWSTGYRNEKKLGFGTLLISLEAMEHRMSGVVNGVCVWVYFMFFFSLLKGSFALVCLGLAAFSAVHHCVYVMLHF